ncbi:hypothetical protein AB1Y20_009557 [Prymnesium parvum]|uniref:Photosystem II reaction center Psb28 protein n=1 Tax=Prymnesium parvum TaxID=97485 RepID=A0AB34K109_PRYPA|mmetsp:Transcript_19915/g.42381  ORF Transcript_19915/g.42381 Transcript_19915/m.42381 type:complete len:180 (+) Transcript_19915:53-592(+)
MLLVVALGALSPVLAFSISSRPVAKASAVAALTPAAYPATTSRPVLATMPACTMQATEPSDGVSAPEAYIEFIVGVPEPCVPDVSLTRSRDGSTGVATFTFDNPSFLAAASQELGETTGMYLKDNEGTMKSTDVTATFVNGRPRIVKGVVVMRGSDEWDRFMRFMERYAQSNGLGFSKA